MIKLAHISQKQGVMLWHYQHGNVAEHMNAKVAVVNGASILYNSIKASLIWC